MSGRGFTLLEVMVALALLAGALMAMADLSGNALRNHAYARDLSAATLLARGKMAELEQKYEDQGFKDFDEHEEGDFSEQGRADVRWRLDLVKPDPNLSGQQLVALLAGTGDPQELLAKVMGGAGTGAAAAAGGAGQGGPTATSPLAGALGTMLTAQLDAFGEIVKRSLREARLAVSWRDGRAERGFTVTTHLLVLNPKAPNGARGDNPEVPPGLVAAPALGTPANPNPASRAPAGQIGTQPAPGAGR